MSSMLIGHGAQNVIEWLMLVMTCLHKTCIKGSYSEVHSGIEFPKHDFQFNYDTNCRMYVAILHHSGLSYNMF